MSFGGLNIALTGIRTAQQELAVIANNVSNVSTPGYTRKILPRSAESAEGVGIGVYGEEIIRNVNLNLARDYWTQVSKTTFYEAQETYLNKIQQFHGAPDAELSIAAVLSDLYDDFVSLATLPDDTFQLQTTLNQAQKTAQKFNNFADLITQLRNDAQEEMSESIDKINRLLNQISDLNKQIKSNLALNKTTAELEDERDRAVRELSDEIEVDFFTRADGTMVIQTNQGLQLADETAETLFFDPAPLGPSSGWPNSAAGIYVGGDPSNTAVTFEITDRMPNGRLGALLELRDAVLPEHMAQLDELAHKLALRLDAQGVRLFTDASGAIPANTAPIPDPPGPLTPVEYVGFATAMQVNEDIVADPSLLQQSTLTGVSVQPGSNDFIRCVANFAFGEYETQIAQGSGVDLSVISGGATTLQAAFGLNPQAQYLGNVNLNNQAAGGPLSTATGSPFLHSDGLFYDDFTIRLDPGGANDTGNIVIDLQTAEAAFPIPPAADGAESLVNYLNATFTGLGAPLDTTQASLNSFGQLIITGQYDFEIGTGSMGDEGLSYLGLEAGTTTAENPYFEVQVGNNEIERISIDPGDTEIDLLTKLNAIDDIEASLDGITGELIIRPGPGFGDDLRVIAGPILSSGNNTVVEEIFGVSDPIINVAHPVFREDDLGPLADQDININGIGDLLTYSQRMVSKQTETAIQVSAQRDDENSFQNILEQQVLGESGVNIEEELSNMITVQTAFSASARTVTAIDDMLKELLNMI